MINFLKMNTRIIIGKGIQAMQQTRRHILEILKERGQATVDDIVEALQKRQSKITAVTVRHHLAYLQKDDLITAPEPRHRATPGRPQHIYALTEKAKDYFPTNYQTLITGILQQIGEQLPPKSVNVILEGVADQMARDAHIPDVSLGERVKLAVEYLNQHGYKAHCEEVVDGYILHTTNCPYHHIAEENTNLCDMDMRLVASMIGVVPRLMARVSSGDSSCAYLIPEKAKL
jgi:predicted ArsR family transcriptional regulator